MTICGIVISVDPDAIDLCALEGQTELTLGELQGVRLPAVLEASDRRHLHQLWEQLERSPGVLQVDLAYADYGADAPPCDSGVQR